MRQQFQFEPSMDDQDQKIFPVLKRYIFFFYLINYFVSFKIVNVKSVILLFYRIV